MKTLPAKHPHREIKSGREVVVSLESSQARNGPIYPQSPDEMYKIYTLNFKTNIYNSFSLLCVSSLCQSKMKNRFCFAFGTKALFGVTVSQYTFNTVEINLCTEGTTKSDQVSVYLLLCLDGFVINIFSVDIPGARLPINALYSRKLWRRKQWACGFSPFVLDFIGLYSRSHPIHSETGMMSRHM